mgnify:CR=1 FL=1
MLKFKVVSVQSLSCKNFTDVSLLKSMRCGFSTVDLTLVWNCLLRVAATRRVTMLDSTLILWLIWMLNLWSIYWTNSNNQLKRSRISLNWPMSKSTYWSYVICLIVLRSTSLNLGARWSMPSTNATYPRTKFGTIKIVSLKSHILMIYL